MDTFRGYVDSAFPLSSYHGIPTFENAAIVLYIQNEPLLDPLLPERTAYVGKKGLGCIISSNLNVDEGKLEFLKLPNSGVSKLICSVNSFTGESYTNINIGGSLDRVKRNLTYLKDSPKSLRILVQMVVLSRNETEVKTFKDFVTDLGFTAQIKSFGTHLDRSPHNLIPLNNSISRYTESHTFQGHACARLWRGPTIDVFENHIMCSTSGHHPSGILGKQHGTDIQSAWNSDAIQELRYGLLTQGRTYKDICTHCDAFLPFQGVWKGAGVD